MPVNNIVPHCRRSDDGSGNEISNRKIREELSRKSSVSFVCAECGLEIKPDQDVLYPGEQGMRALALRKLVNTTSAPQQAPQVVFSQPPVAYPAPVQYYEPAPVAVPQAYTAPAYYNQGYGY